jgi:hypothetical protein
MQSETIPEEYVTTLAMSDLQTSVRDNVSARKAVFSPVGYW